MSNNIDLDFYEKVIIYNCLKKGNEEYLASCIEYLNSDLFSNRDIAVIIDLIKDFYIRNNTIPNITEIKSMIVNKTLKDSFVNIVKSFRDLDTSYTLNELIKNTEFFIKQRLLCKCIEESVEEHGKSKQINEIRTLKQIDDITSISLIDNLGMDFFKDTENFVSKLTQNESFISTGYEHLDREFGGGLFKEGKSIYCIAGETNIGKSIVLANIATNVILQGYNVVIISLEMSEFRYAKRIASMLTNISQMDLVSRSDEFVEFAAKIHKDKQSRLFIKEFPTKQVSAKHIAGYIKKLERQKSFKPDLIVLDYHTLLKPSVPQGTKHADMQFITQESRALAYVFEAPVLTAAQLNRSDGNVTPELNRIAGSWDMLSDMDYLISIWQHPEDREVEIIRWVLKKARDSGRNVEHFWNINYQTLRLSEDETGDNSEQLTELVSGLLD